MIVRKLIVRSARSRAALSVAGVLLATWGSAWAVLPVQGQGVTERPIGTQGFVERPAFVDGGFFEAHPGQEGQLWILDRQTGRVRSCAPPVAADQAPRCSPWSP